MESNVSAIIKKRGANIYKNNNYYKFNVPNFKYLYMTFEIVDLLKKKTA